jgi:outer membrane protein assembly factor BamB
MRSRPVAAAVLLLGLTALVSAETPKVFSRAMPPDKAALDRLNLRTEWTQYVPVGGRGDTIALVQTFDDQVFVQTRIGLLTCLDARTGEVKWSAMLGNGEEANIYPVAVNGRFVFAANVTRLFAFYRYTGVVEFTTDLGTPPTAGLSADDFSLYAVLATRPGAAGAERITAFDLPRGIALPNPAQVAATKPNERDTRAVNPVDELTRRYPTTGVSRIVTREVESEGPARPRDVGGAGVSGSRTPSLAVVGRVTPPYFKEGGEPVRSLVVVPSLRKPYHFRDETMRDIQRTPSVGTIPPSVAAALALADLRPRGVEPHVRWEYGTTVGVNFRIVQTPQRVWAATNRRSLLALSKVDKAVEVNARLFEDVAAPAAQAGTTGYFPLVDGSLLAIDLTGGNLAGGFNLVWQANIGGLMNRTPVVTEDAVFVSGDGTGVARVERATGVVTWRSDRAVDRVVAVNQDFAYLQDRQGRLHVFDARRANSPVRGRAVPLATIDLSSFNVPVTNTATDRVLVAADNGLLVCLRDASAKYAAPVRMAPPVTVNPVPKEGVDAGDAMPMGDMVPPKKE